MTDDQFYITRDMQDLLVKYLDTIKDPLEEVRISQEWRKFIDRCGWDKERLFYSASGSIILGKEIMTGFKEGLTKGRLNELKHETELTNTQHWKRKKKGK